jgi:hypothetical protein
MRLNRPRKIDLRHLVIMVLEHMHGQGLRDMPPVFPVPHLKIGKIPGFGQKNSERPLQILDLAIRQLLPPEPEFHQLIII